MLFKAFFVYIVNIGACDIMKIIFMENVLK